MSPAYRTLVTKPLRRYPIAPKRGLHAAGTVGKREPDLSTGLKVRSTTCRIFGSRHHPYSPHQIGATYYTYTCVSNAPIDVWAGSHKTRCQ